MTCEQFSVRSTTGSEGPVELASGVSGSNLGLVGAILRKVVGFDDGLDPICVKERTQGSGHRGNDPVPPGIDSSSGSRLLASELEKVRRGRMVIDHLHSREFEGMKYRYVELKKRSIPPELPLMTHINSESLRDDRKLV